MTPLFTTTPRLEEEFRSDITWPLSPVEAQGMSVGAGEQIAVTHFHQYNHAKVLSIRFPF